MDGRSRSLLLVLGAVVVLAVPITAVAKDLRTVVCGRDGCRVSATPLAGVATTGRAPAPPTGRFFTLRLSFPPGARSGYVLIYERKRQLVRAGDANARSFLGRGWHLLAADVRPHYASAVRGRVARSRP